MLNVPSEISDRAMIIYLKLADCQFQRLLILVLRQEHCQINLFGKMCFYGVRYVQVSTELWIHNCSEKQRFTVIGTQNPCPENSKKIFRVDTFLLVKQSKRIKNANFGRYSPYNFSLAPTLIVRLSCCLKKKIAIYFEFNL